MHRYLAALLIAGAWAICAVFPSCAQTPAPDAGPAPCSVAPDPPPCSAAPALPGKQSTDKQSTKDRLPFPEEDSATPGAPVAPNISGIPQAPDAPSSAASAGKKGANNPFPDDVAKPDASAFGSSSPGSSSSSSSSNPFPYDPDDKSDATPAPADKNTDPGQPSGRHLLHRVNPVGTKLQSPEEREVEDLSVAHLYMDTGDLKGAYMRGQDAVKLAPSDPDAHFALAQAAEKLKKPDEAIAEYTACLKLDPIDKEAREAHKALARLSH